MEAVLGSRHGGALDLGGLGRRQPIGPRGLQGIALGLADRLIGLRGEVRSADLAVDGRAELARNQRAEHRDREHTGDPRDRVVDPRCHADAILRDRVERRGREWCHRRR